MATVTVTFSSEKLDALTFHMEKKEADLQEELKETMQKLYEKYVPQSTREYLDARAKRTSPPRVRPNRPVQPPL